MTLVVVHGTAVRSRTRRRGSYILLYTAAVYHIIHTLLLLLCGLIGPHQVGVWYFVASVEREGRANHSKKASKQAHVMVSLNQQ